MEFARELISAVTEGFLFPSVAGGDDNLIVYLSIAGEGRFPSKDEREVIDQVKRMASRYR